jgi:hypothetical protein
MRHGAGVAVLGLDLGRVAHRLDDVVDPATRIAKRLDGHIPAGAVLPRGSLRHAPPARCATLPTGIES